MGAWIPVDLAERRCYDRVVVAEESDRIAMVSDLVALEKRLVLHFEERLVLHFDERLKPQLEERLKEHHTDMRRHFDVMVERVEAAVRIVAEVNAHHAVVLDDHEMRLRTIEKAR